jgi:RNA-directed DNA polymerase
VKPRGHSEGLSIAPAQAGRDSCGDQVEGLMETVVAVRNMDAAYKKVVKNGGAPGVDGVTTGQLWEQLEAEWKHILPQLLGGTYIPEPVRRVEIPKPDGGVRMLGIPTVMDRFIQQLLLQALVPIFDPTFSESSMGFRPGRKARDAVKLARGFGEEGRRWVVDIDLEKFFDRVNHDILMAWVARKVKDKRALRLIRAFLEAGIMVDGVAMRREEGTPQGGPLSPLLANIMLDDLDKELERRGHKFARYADDCNICVSSRRAGERVLASVRQFLEDRLKLKVNEAKSGVVRPWKSKFLGFTVYTQKGMSLGIRVAPKTLKRVKDKLRELTDRNRSENLEQRIVKVNDYIRGWIAYFALADAKKMLAALHGWVCRRLRACVWKQWKRVRTRIREMRALGFPDWKVFGWANDRRGPWAIAGTTLNSILPASYWRKLGLVHFVEFYEEHRQT